MGLLLIDEKFLPHAYAAVEGAKKEIVVSTFKAEMTSKPRGHDLFRFFSALVKKARDGVRVRVLLNWNDNRQSVAKTNLYVMHELKKNNISVRYLKNNRCCHAKLILIDRENAIIGSHNLSIKSCHNNFETSFVISDPGEIAKLSNVFDSSWYDAHKY